MRINIPVVCRSQFKYCNNKGEQEILLFMCRCLVRKSFEGAVCSHQLVADILQNNSHFIMS